MFSSNISKENRNRNYFGLTNLESYIFFRKYSENYKVKYKFKGILLS